MKTFTVLCLVACIAFAASAPGETEQYSSRYDNFNVKELEENDRLLTAYIQCFTGTGNCTPEGSDINKKIRSAVENSCAQCSPAQRKIIREMIPIIQKKHPADWKLLEAKFDPEDKYKVPFKAFMESKD